MESSGADLNPRSKKELLLVVIAMAAVAVCIFAVPAISDDSDATDASDIFIGESEETVSGDEDPDCWGFVGVMLAVIIVSGIIIFAMKKTGH